MPLIKNTVQIQKPLFDVFKAAGSFEEWEQWQPSTKQVVVTSGNPVRSGTMVSMRRGTSFVNADVVDFQRNKEMQLKGRWGRFPFTRNIRFESAGGATTIIDELNIKTGWLFFWYAPILQMTLNNEINGEWQNLKKRLNG